MAGESEKRDGTELVCDDSVSESRERLTSANSRSAQLDWPTKSPSNCSSNHVLEIKTKPRLDVESDDCDSMLKKQGSKVTEMQMMEERFSKLLLGEDMSGSGKGVCPAMAISNAITNLCATVFGQLWRLEPLPPEKKTMWKREMEWLLSVSDYIVELKPSWQTFHDGSRIEVMTSRPRSDLVINLPALRKLDNMLLDILEGFTETEFWYVDQGVIAPETDEKSVSSCEAIQRQGDKWWLPVPRVPPGGLPETTKKQLIHKREFASQILKAAMAINSIALAEMEVPDSYLETLPKNGRACLGDVIYRCLTSDHFSSESLLDCLDLSSEHVALEMANQVEAAMYVWHRRQHPKPRTHTRSSWEIVRELMMDGDKRELLAERAESLLQCLKHRFPGLTQTTLDSSKIHCNKDVGKSILESYSRVLESLAFNIVARIEDLLYVDDINKQSEKLPSMSLICHKKVSVPFHVPASGTPFRSACNFSPAPLISPARGEMTPFLGGNGNKPPRRGLGVKRVLTNYLGGEFKAKNCSNTLQGLSSVSDRIPEGTTATNLGMEKKDQSSVHTVSRPSQIDR